MKNKFSLYSLIFAAVIALVLNACNKDEVENPVGTEPINFIQPDSSTIFASAGALVDFTLYLAIDHPIDSVRGAYFIDTTRGSSLPGVNALLENLTYADMQTEFFVQGFSDSLNVQTVSGVLEMPSTRTDGTGFWSYFAGSTTPFLPAQYDAVRVIFQIEAGSSRYEKQLKVIVD